MVMALGLIFTIEVDGTPTVAFEARKLREAAELCAEEWLREDMRDLRSDGVPLCTVASKFRARTADVAERALYREGASAVRPSDDILLVYLVDLDTE
jgi:hypothetical protein